MRAVTLVLLVAIPVACSSESTNEAATGGGGAGGTGGTAGAGGSGATVSGGGSGGSSGDAGVEAGCGGFSQRFGGSGAEVATSYMVTDGTGAVLVAGTFKGTVDFGGGPLTSPSNTSYDGFLLKLDASGKYLWAKQFADSASTNIKKVRVSADATNNVYVSFEFIQTVKIAGSPPLQSAGGADVAVAKLSSNGDLQWAKRYGGSEDESGGVVAHASGAWSLHGHFKSSVLDFGGASSTTLSKANTANTDAFAAAFDGSGAVSWSRKFGGSGNQVVSGLGDAFPTDGAAAFLASFAGDLNFGSGACPLLPGTGSAIGKLSSSGSCTYQVHAKPAVEGGTGSLALWYARTTASNGLVVAGAVFGSVDLIAGGSTTPLVSHGDADLALVKLDTFGAVTKALAFGDAGYQEIGGLALDASGNIFLAGYSTGSLDFGGGELKSVGAEDVFIARLDPDGKHLFSARYGDAASQSVSSLAVGPDGRTVVAGTFAGGIDFGTGPGSAMTAQGNRDLYVAKLCQ